MGWVKRGLIKVWDGPRAIDDDDWPKEHFDLTGMALTMQRTEDAVMATLARTLGKPYSRPDLGATCPCGCLLASETESCPNCLVWAIADEIRASWSAAETYYAPIGLEMAA